MVGHGKDVLQDVCRYSLAPFPETAASTHPNRNLADNPATWGGMDCAEAPQWSRTAGFDAFTGRDSGVMRCNAMLSGMLESTNTTLMPLVGAPWSVRLISLCLLVGGLSQGVSFLRYRYSWGWGCYIGLATN